MKPLRCTLINIFLKTMQDRLQTHHCSLQSGGVHQTSKCVLSFPETGLFDVVHKCAAGAADNIKYGGLKRSTRSLVVHKRKWVFLYFVVKITIACVCCDALIEPSQP